MLLNRQVQTMLGGVAIAALASAQDQAAAATLEVTATVASACTVESGSLDFGAYQAGPQAPSLEGSGGFNCAVHLAGVGRNKIGWWPERGCWRRGSCHERSGERQLSELYPV